MTDRAVSLDGLAFWTQPVPGQPPFGTMTLSQDCGMSKLGGEPGWKVLPVPATIGPFCQKIAQVLTGCAAPAAPVHLAWCT